jgi:hypothetical protein
MTPPLDKILPIHDPNASLSHAGDFNLVAMILDYSPMKIKRLKNELEMIDKRRAEINLEIDQLQNLLSVVEAKT